MRGYGMCIDYTSKRIESVSNATLARISEQQSAPNASITSKSLKLALRSKISRIDHAPANCL